MRSHDEDSKKKKVPPSTHGVAVQKGGKREKRFTCYIMDNSIFYIVNKATCVGRIDEQHDLHKTSLCTRRMSSLG